MGDRFIQLTMMVSLTPSFRSRLKGSSNSQMILIVLASLEFKNSVFKYDLMGVVISVFSPLSVGDGSVGCECSKAGVQLRTLTQRRQPTMGPPCRVN